MTREEARRIANKTIDNDLRRCCDGLPHGLAECESAVAVSVAIGAAEQRKRDAEIARRYFFYPWPAEQICEIIAKNIENEGIL